MRSSFKRLGNFLFAFHPSCVWLRPYLDRSADHWSFVWLGVEVAHYRGPLV